VTWALARQCGCAQHPCGQMGPHRVGAGWLGASAVPKTLSRQIAKQGRAEFPLQAAGRAPLGEAETGPQTLGGG
jgi:hypothetical protein